MLLKDKTAMESSPLARLKALRQLPREERSRVLRAQAVEIAVLLQEDLVKPVPDRELTALTALDGIDPIVEDSEIGE